jgi:hypothetical protein
MKTRLKEEEITDVPEKKSQFAFRNTFQEGLLRFASMPRGSSGASANRGIKFRSRSGR